MKRLLFIGGVAMISAFIGYATLSAISPTVGLISPSLMVIIALIMRFRISEAYLSAAVTGIVGDILSGAPFGATVLLWFGITIIMSMLFTRIFAHISLMAFLTMNAIGFMTVLLGNAIINTVRATFGGLPIAPSLDAGDMQIMLIGLGMHIGGAVIVLYGGRLIRKILAPLTIVSS